MNMGFDDGDEIMVMIWTRIMMMMMMVRRTIIMIEAPRQWVEVLHQEGAGGLLNIHSLLHSPLTISSIAFSNTHSSLSFFPHPHHHYLYPLVEGLTHGTKVSLTISVTLNHDNIMITRIMIIIVSIIIILIKKRVVINPACPPCRRPTLSLSDQGQKSGDDEEDDEDEEEDDDDDDDGDDEEDDNEEEEDDDNDEEDDGYDEFPCDGDANGNT